VADDQFTNTDGKFTGLTSTNVIVARVTPQSGKDPDYYKIRLLSPGGADFAPTAISIGGTAVNPLPAANTAATGTTSVNLSLANIAAFNSVAVSVTKPNTYVDVAYGLASANNVAPEEYITSGPLLSAKPAQWVVIRVMSGDRSITRYYKVRLLLTGGSDLAALATLSIGGSAITTDDLPAANTAATGTTAINHTVASLTNLTVTATASPNATIAYAAASANNTAPAAAAYNTDGKFASFNNAEWVVIRVTSQSGTVVSYYKVRVASGKTSSAITALKVNGATITPLPVANDAAGGTNAVTYVLPNQAAGLASVAVDVTTDGASVDFNVATDLTSGPTTWPNGDGRWTNFAKGSVVVIRVISQDTVNTSYYKVRLTYGSSNAALTDIKINNTSITAESGVTIPAPNTAVTGTTAVLYHVPAAANLTNLTAAVTAPAGASVAYAAAAAANTNVTAWTNTNGVFAAFTATQYLVIRVISEDTTTINYYKVRVGVGSSAAAITGISVNSVAVSSLPATNAAVTGTTAVTHTDTLARNPVTIAVTGASTGATVNYASAAAANTNTAAANFTATTSFPGFTSGQYVVIRVVSADTLTTVYYKVQVIHGNADSDLDLIRINNVAVDPTPAANSAVTGTNAGTLATTLASVTVKVSVAPGASVAYASAATDSATVSTWTNLTGVFTNFTDGQYLVIRVISQNGQSTTYYKVKLTAGS
jgi:hypothetical protein